MRGLFKTLFGDRHTLFLVADCIIIAIVLLATPLRWLTGMAFPLMLLGGAAFLAKR